MALHVSAPESDLHRHLSQLHAHGLTYVTPTLLSGTDTRLPPCPERYTCTSDTSSVMIYVHDLLNLTAKVSYIKDT